MIDLKDYQEKAIEKLKTETNELLEYTEGKICVFKAPTGSGKTLMTAEFLKITLSSDFRLKVQAIL